MGTSFLGYKSKTCITGKRDDTDTHIGNFFEAIIIGRAIYNNSMRIKHLNHFEKAGFEVGTIFKLIKPACNSPDRNYAVIRDAVETVIPGFFGAPADIINDRDEKGNQIKFQLPSSKNMPSAFICNCDETAANLITALEEKGYKIPDDISVTGFDNYLPQKKTSVGLTTIYIRPEDLTKTAADLIINKITGQPYTKGRHLVSGSLVKRDSVKPFRL